MIEMLHFAKVSLDFNEEPVLASLDLQVAAGEFVVVIGPSGCGKTTLLRLASGLLPPSAGRVENQFLRTASVYQDPRLPPWASAVDNAAFGLKALGQARHERRQRAATLLRRLGLAEADLAKRPAALSGGMRQRVAIARALAVEPGLLLMDEPFAALDIGLRRHLQDLVRDEAQSRRIAALFVTHDIAEAIRLASRIIVLSPRPAHIVADIPNIPLCDPAEIFAAAAALLRHPEIESALFPPRAEPQSRKDDDARRDCPRCDRPDCASY
jgi:NitT/TauT family transport system ATP-binding protein